MNNIEPFEKWPDNACNSLLIQKKSSQDITLESRVPTKQIAQLFLLLTSLCSSQSACRFQNYGLLFVSWLCSPGSDQAACGKIMLFCSAAGHRRLVARPRKCRTHNSRLWSFVSWLLIFIHLPTCVSLLISQSCHSVERLDTDSVARQRKRRRQRRPPAHCTVPVLVRSGCGHAGHHQRPPRGPHLPRGVRHQGLVPPPPHYPTPPLQRRRPSPATVPARPASHVGVGCRAPGASPGPQRQGRRPRPSRGPWAGAAW